MPQYLSTDPSAGLEGDKRYISTDPNAGDTSNGSDQRGTSGVPPGLVVGSSMAAAPGIVSLINQAARLGGKVTVARAANIVPAFVAADAIGDVVAGDPRSAAQKTAAAVAITQAPKIASAIERATSPAVAAQRNAIGRFTSIGRQAGPVARAASTVSRFAGPAAIATQAIFGDAQPAGETPDEAAAAVQQDINARRRMNQINATAGRQIVTGNTTREILASLANFEQMNSRGNTRSTEDIAREAIREISKGR